MKLEERERGGEGGRESERERERERKGGREREREREREVQMGVLHLARISEYLTTELSTKAEKC